MAWVSEMTRASPPISALGVPIAMPIAFRHAMVAVLGVMLGSGFSPEMLAHLGDWAVSLASLALYGVAAGGAGLVYFRRIWGYDPVTAYFAAMPGGLSEMSLVGGCGRREGADGL